MRDLVAIRRVERREYTETDVHSLLINSRSTTRNLVLKELGDLYAHRERDKGLIAMRAFLHGLKQRCLHSTSLTKNDNF